jgi:hypothetical protein
VKQYVNNLHAKIDQSGDGSVEIDLIQTFNTAFARILLVCALGEDISE